MRASIMFRDAQGREGTIELGSEAVYVGRSHDCAIRTDDAVVSRKHAVIRFQDNRYWIEDLGSANGIEIGNKTVRRHELSHNDTVRCGALWLRYVEGDPSLPQRTAPPLMGPRPMDAFAEGARTVLLPRRELRQVMVPDVAEVQRLGDYIQELLRQLMELRQELEQTKAGQARTAAELEELRRKLE
jgi:predicted component of type VI protein secretion system